MIFLAQDAPPLPPDAAPWMVVLIIIISTISYMVKRHYDIQLEKAKVKIDTQENKIIHLEQTLEKVKAVAYPPIVYIEDYPEDFELVRVALRDAGCQHPLVWLTSIEDGNWYVKQNTTFAVLVDMNLVANGSRFLDLMKSDPTTADVPIIVISGSAERKAEAFERGAIGFLDKPIRISHFLTILRNQGYFWHMERV